MKNLSTNDGHRGKSFPERRESIISTAIVPEHGTSSLNSINHAYQALHSRHVQQQRMNKVEQTFQTTSETLGRESEN